MLKAKKIISVIVSIFLVLSSGIITVQATTIANGTCGKNINWSLDSEGILLISGSGDMNNYDPSRYKYAPWYDQKANIKAIQIENGLTGIGNCAFYECTNLKTVNVPNSITNIGSRAFYMCTSLQEITLPESVITIGSSAFYSCKSK